MATSFASPSSSQPNHSPIQSVESRPENPWQLAIRTLSEEDRRAIDESIPDKLAVLEGVLIATEEKKKRCLKNRWQYKKRNGEIVIIRDVLEKIVRWIDQFKQIGDAAIQYDPVHAALPWAAVRFLIQVLFPVL